MRDVDIDSMQRQCDAFENDAFVRINAPSRIAVQQLRVQCEILENLRAIRALLERPPMMIQNVEPRPFTPLPPAWLR